MPKMTSFAKTTALMACTTLLLAGCASITDTPNQQTQVLTPGATGSRCDIRNDFVHYVVNPPEKVMLLRARDALTVTCEAPGNRSKTTVIYPKFNPSATENMANVGLGGVYDYFSGALYEYPNPIIVDFSQTQASNHDLPGYHAPDTVSPFDQQPEDMRDGLALHPGESYLPPAAAPLKEQGEDEDGVKSGETSIKVDGAGREPDAQSTGDPSQNDRTNAKTAPADSDQSDDDTTPMDGTDIGS